MIRHRKKVFFAILVLGVFVSLEVISFCGGKLLQKKWAMWRVPTEPKTRKEHLTYDEYLNRRDPVLGWPYPCEIGRNLDVNGAQRNPFFPTGPADGSYISLYGDSFTEGGDTSSLDHNWGNVLSRKIGRYIANYGMGGYGTDQAFLRFRENANDPSPIVVFGIHTGDTLRNVTRVRDLEVYEQWFALKPRFILNGGKLELIPIPDLTEDEYRRVLTERSPQLILPHENLHPGGAAGAVKLKFPFTLSVAMNFGRFNGFKSRLFGQPGHMAFLKPGHRLQTLEIMTMVTREFVDLAKKRQKTPIVLILPHLEDLNYFIKTERWPYQHVVDSFNCQSIAFIDFGPPLASMCLRENRSVSEFFGPTAHYNDVGNERVAEFVFDYLRENRLTSVVP